MNIRSIILLVVLGLPAALLLAVGPRGKYGIPPDRTVVRYWEKWTGVEGRVMERVVDRFNETVGAAEGIFVAYSAVSSIEQRMLIATAGGDPPDVAGLYDFIVPQYADQGALQPLDELAPAAGIQLDALKPIWLDICRYQGQLYALPSTPYTIALYYNRALFRAAGLDPDHPPATTAEFNEYVKRLTLSEPITLPDGTKSFRITQAGFTPSAAMLGWWPWVWPYFFDGSLWDGQHCTLDTPAGRAAVQWIAQQRAYEGAGPMIAFEATAGAIESAQNPFLSGRLAMLFQGPWISNWIAKYAPALDYDVAPFPSVTPERQNVLASSDVFVIPAGSHHPKEALRFLAYILRQDVMEDLCLQHNKISPFRHPSPDFYAKHPNKHIRIFDELADSPYAFGYPSMPMWAQVKDETKVLQDTILRDPASALSELQKKQREIDKIVSDYQYMAAVRRGESK